MDASVIELQRSSTNLSDYAQTLSIGQLLRPAYAGGSITVPISQGLPATHFKHVSGIPGANPGTGIPLSKLQALDALIDRLVQMNIHEAPPTGPNMADGELDALIGQISQDINHSFFSGLGALVREYGVSMGLDLSHTGVFLDSMV